MEELTYVTRGIFIRCTYIRID